MTVTIIDGKAVAAALEAELRHRVAALRGPPRLAVVQVGDDPASTSYIRAKAKAAARVGLDLKHHHLPVATTRDELTALVDRLNRETHGLIVQLPLPPGLDTVLERIDPARDVDGFHPVNLGRLVAGLPGLRPCTPAGILELLARSGHDVAGRHVVIVGRSTIVGKPLALLLGRKGTDATVTVCHSRTPDLAHHTRQAEVLVAAVGRAATITADMVRPGAVVVDVGVNRVTADNSRGYRLAGDCAADVAEVAGALTPVPGGVGPMTVAMLMANTVQAAESVE